MEHNLEQLKKEMARVTLSSQEKSGIRTRLAVFMHDRPVVAKKTFAERIQAGLALAQPTFRLAPVIVIVLLFTGGGITQIAENSLPGDILYPVKTSINEEVKGFFVSSEEDAALFEAELAAKRLDELEKITTTESSSVAERSFSIESQPEPLSQSKIVEDLNVRFEAHLERAEEKVRLLESEERSAKADKVKVERVKEKIKNLNERRGRSKSFKISDDATLFMMVPDAQSIGNPESSDNARAKGSGDNGGAPELFMMQAPAPAFMNIEPNTATSTPQERIELLKKEFGEHRSDFERKERNIIESRLDSLEDDIDDGDKEPEFIEKELRELESLI